MVRIDVFFLVIRINEDEIEEPEDEIEEVEMWVLSFYYSDIRTS